MSRVGRMPIDIPAGVNVNLDGQVITVKGPKGTLTQDYDPAITITVDGNVAHHTYASPGYESYSS